jgi:hypothetical protein
VVKNVTGLTIVTVTYLFQIYFRIVQNPQGLKKAMEEQPFSFVVSSDRPESFRAVSDVIGMDKEFRA